MIFNEPISHHLRQVHKSALAAMRRYARPYRDFRDVTANLRKLAGAGQFFYETAGYVFYTHAKNKTMLVKVPKRQEVDSMRDAATDLQNGLVVAEYINRVLVGHKFSSAEVGVYVCVTVLKNASDLGAMRIRPDGAPVRWVGGGAVAKTKPRRRKSALA